MSQKKPVLILVRDSRLHGFEKFRYDNFRFRFLIESGAIVENLVSDTLSILREYKGTDRSIIMKIACDINEFTKFDYHKDGKDLRLRSDVSNSGVLDQLKQFKQKIKSEIPTAVVGFVTVPTLSFVIYREFLAKKNKDKNRRGQTRGSKERRHRQREQGKSKSSEEELKIDQEKLDKELLLLNTSLKLENSRKQTGLLKGCHTISWHN